MQLKSALLSIFLILTLAACTTEQIPEAKALDNIIDTAFEDLPEPALSPPTESVPANSATTIEINGAFIPETITITAGATVTWESNDEKPHKISCYELGKRTAYSGRLEKGDSFTYKFDLRGEKLCIDPVMGYRGTIIVEQAVVNSITGNAIGATGTSPPLGVTLLLLGMLLSFCQIAIMYRK
ncbi:MAG: hypothetical protein O2779_02670 [Nanoarchaeota archaeon]|nr:hypothetical protein [Nanoarchaeota archaeon]